MIWDYDVVLDGITFYPDKIDQQMHSVHLFNGKEFASHLFKISECDKIFTVHDGIRPKVSVLPVPVINISKYIAALDNIVTECCTNSSINRIITQARGKEGIILRQEFTDKIIAFDHNPGSFSGQLSPEKVESYVKNCEDKILKRIRSIIEQLNFDFEEWQKTINLKHEHLLLQAETFRKYKFPHHNKSKIENFVTKYEQLSKEKVMSVLLINSKEYLEDIYSTLEKTFYSKDK